MKKTENRDYLLENVFEDLAKEMKSRADPAYNNPLPYLRSYYRLYKQTKDELKKQEILEKMAETIGRRCKQFIMPKGLDKEAVEIFQLLGYRI